MQSKQIIRTQENKEKKQKTENVINSDLTLGLKRGLGKQNKGTDKRREAENGQ